MNILASYYDIYTDIDYNIVSGIQNSDMLRFKSVYIDVNETFHGVHNYCQGIYECKSCILKNVDNCGSITTWSDNIFTNYFPNFKENHPELFV